MARVAVLGAGFQGTCAALELAHRGAEVDLYDQNDACITQAGLRNEGKIHLGFVYANDPSFATARLMVRGALGFAAALRRWLDCDISGVGLSTPHSYVVHRDSMLSAQAVLAHFTRVRNTVRELATAAPCHYLDQDARSIAFDIQAPGAAYDSELVAAVIQTDERSIDVVRLAALLRARVAAEPRISFHPGTCVTAAAREDAAIAVSFRRQGAVETARYQTVVNCLWDGKAAIDRQMQFLPPYRSLYRLKFGVNIALQRTELAVPSATFVVGPFGDIVQFDDRLYLSWYPVARRGLSHALTPPDWPRELSGEDARRMIDATLAAFTRMVPPLRGLPGVLCEQARVTGGVILAAGETDIDDPDSGLHGRTAVGVRSTRGYHSVDTGKYTLAPMYAIEIADRICDSSG